MTQLLSPNVYRFGPRTLRILPQPNLILPNASKKRKKPIAVLAIERMSLGCGSTINNY